MNVNVYQSNLRNAERNPNCVNVARIWKGSIFQSPKMVPCWDSIFHSVMDGVLLDKLASFVVVTSLALHNKYIHASFSCEIPPKCNLVTYKYALLGYNYNYFIRAKGTRCTTLFRHLTRLTLQFCKIFRKNKVKPYKLENSDYLCPF